MGPKQLNAEVAEELTLGEMEWFQEEHAWWREQEKVACDNEKVAREQRKRRQS